MRDYLNYKPAPYDKVKKEISIQLWLAGLVMSSGVLFVGVLALLKWINNSN